jgi:hypothetical protein
MERHITLPLTEELAKSLKAGDSVYVTGTIYTSRDAGHKRMCEALARGEERADNHCNDECRNYGNRPETSSSHPVLRVQIFQQFIFALL